MHFASGKLAACAHLVHLLRRVNVAITSLLGVEEGAPDHLNLQEASRLRSGLTRLQDSGECEGPSVTAAR